MTDLNTTPTNWVAFLIIAAFPGFACQRDQTPETPPPAPAPAPSAQAAPAAEKESDTGDPAADPAATDLAPGTVPGVRSLITPGRLPVDIMALMAPREAQEIMAKIQAAATADPEWWAAHIEKAEPGSPLTYDPKLGVTELEYRRFLELSGRQTAQKESSGELLITDGPTAFSLSTAGRNSPT